MDDKIAEEIREAAGRRPLAAVVSDVLSKQAESRLHYMPPERVSQVVEASDVTRDSASLPSGNVVEILDRGPEGDLEHGLLGALAVSHLVDVHGAERNALLSRFVEHALWLDTQTPYRLFTFVDRLLEASVAASVWCAVADRAIEERGASPESASRAAGLMAALRASDSEAAATELDRVLRAVGDRLVGGRRSTTSAGKAELAGLGRRFRSTGRFRVLRLVTGWAVLAWLARGLGALLGMREKIRVSLGETGVDVSANRRVLGREVGREEASYTFSSIRGATRTSRYPDLSLRVGAACLGLGVLAGGWLAGEGLWTGETFLLVVGAGIVLTGALLDLALTNVPWARRAHVALELDLEGGRRVSVEAADEAQADAFLQALRTRLSTATQT